MGCLQRGIASIEVLECLLAIFPAEGYKGIIKKLTFESKEVLTRLSGNGYGAVQLLVLFPSETDVILKAIFQGGLSGNKELASFFILRLLKFLPDDIKGDVKDKLAAIIFSEEWQSKLVICMINLSFVCVLLKTHFPSKGCREAAKRAIFETEGKLVELIQCSLGILNLLSLFPSGDCRAAIEKVVFETEGKLGELIKCPSNVSDLLRLFPVDHCRAAIEKVVFETDGKLGELLQVHRPDIALEKLKKAFPERQSEIDAVFNAMQSSGSPVGEHGFFSHGGASGSARAGDEVRSVVGHGR